ncbi:helix-turn-helix transcriptional regulator [Pectobacterium brasiliense]|uniref:Helix-turn-helix transcriptional regulator n=1 Tax=Pectobacterium brasiliense TaxID=180957 RepID=A0AAE2WF73_9GAMM|nr:helix-turn-helix domain-containing protein [Pectobacterium brasiliense]MBA0215852.1 helix-turn-helix transcriptional regulator [Pectobacterium brasiliense]MBN3050734.1 helix-turn-helix transcriptional regulator [Pectobacterium brasiliense]MBN3072580.1 helix-turn-helix transcriptional regulator [Pectobacterium brasiliense]MBN3168342.1 helix-turn-helix transcriptional regulator [Pectobacterium brasiliense]
MQKNETVVPPECFSADCPARALFDQISDKWSMMVLITIEAGPVRFNAIKHRLEGVTQKALTQCLRRLERNGLLTRHVIATSPVAVEYEITPLGRTLLHPFKVMHDWTMSKIEEVESARQRFDQRGL